MPGAPNATEFSDVFVFSTSQISRDHCFSSADRPSRQGHDQCKQGQAGGEAQGLWTGSCKARRTEASAHNEANDKRPGVLRPVTCLGHFGWVMP